MRARSLLATSAALSLAASTAGCGAEAPPPLAPSPVTTASAAPPPPAIEEAAPGMRLPEGTRPTAQAIELQIDPAQERYRGQVDIDVELAAPRRTLWLHGKDLHVTRATVTPRGGQAVEGQWSERPDQMASVTLASPAPAGGARLHLEFDAAFGRGQHGLYKTREADADYVFTQFEPTAARLAFPCFDEPSLKVPFTLSLVVPERLTAVANTREASRAPAGQGAVRVTFAPTVPLPSYLVAFAVGNLDVVSGPDVPPNAVRARALPLRGVAAHGRGAEMAYALGHAGEILATLERYVGIPYPYDKLDLAAVPGKGGAMENPGLVTFGERFLAFDGAKAPVWQRRDYAGIVAHELAHMWTGDLVTMAWWDDTWLNEAFATWLGTKAAEAWDPKLRAELGLLDVVERTMGVDALVAARAIRQPIASANDVENAFDAITYDKGAAVLRMFERWAGAEAWQKGLHAYLESHRFGNATADEFLQAEGVATGKDVKTPFHTFLDQPGVPVLDASLSCGPREERTTLRLAQSRYLPLGSAGSKDVTWQIPVCARADGVFTCALLAGATGSVDLPKGKTCPAWVLPNGDGTGYYRFALPARDLLALRDHLGALTEAERLVFADSVHAGWARGTTTTQEAVAAVAPLASDALPDVAERPMEYVTTARDWLWATPAQARVEAYGRQLYGGIGRRLGWEPRKGEDDDVRSLRGSVLAFLANTARDPATLAEARQRGRRYLGLGPNAGARGDGAIHPEAVDPELGGLAAVAVGRTADRATFDALRATLARSNEEVVRARLVRALASAEDPALAAAGRELTLDPSLRDTEVLVPLSVQMGDPRTRAAAWAWMKEHYDAVMARVPRHHSGPRVIGLGRAFCDEEHAADVESFFGTRAQAIEGGPRSLASTIEAIRLCAARRKAQEPSASALPSR